MIDDISLKILKILQEKARIPNVEVARQVGMAPSAVLERIRKLEKQGIIEGYEVRINPEYFDCTVPAGQTFFHQTHPQYTAFIYVIDGVGKTAGEAVENGILVLFDEGEQFAVSAASETLRFLLLTGKPLNEPVAWRGPIVMNTQAELELAFREYREGTFIKNK